jgi:hypothetical protein
VTRQRVLPKGGGHSKVERWREAMRAIAFNGLQLPKGRAFNHQTSFETLHYKYTTFPSTEALNPCF